jgi:hypothetical protein
MEAVIKEGLSLKRAAGAEETMFQLRAAFGAVGPLALATHLRDSVFGDGKKKAEFAFKTLHVITEDILPHMPPPFLSFLGPGNGPADLLPPGNSQSR